MGNRQAPSIPPKPPRRPPAPPDRTKSVVEDQFPFSRFLRALLEGKVTGLSIEGEGIVETGDGRRVAQLVRLSVTAGTAHETFKLDVAPILSSNIIPVLGLQMDRVDMLIPDSPTGGQKIDPTEGSDA